MWYAYKSTSPCPHSEPRILNFSFLDIVHNFNISDEIILGTFKDPNIKYIIFANPLLVQSVTPLGHSPTDISADVTSRNFVDLNPHVIGITLVVHGIAEL